MSELAAFINIREVFSLLFLGLIIILIIIAKRSARKKRNEDEDSNWI